VRQQTEQYIQKPNHKDGNNDNPDGLSKGRDAWNKVDKVKDHAADNRRDDELKKQGYHVALVTIWIYSRRTRILNWRSGGTRFSDDAEDAFVAGAKSAA
jgi:hypothetical protein